MNTATATTAPTAAHAGIPAALIAADAARRASLAACKAAMIASARRAAARGHAPDEPQCPKCETYASDLAPHEQLDPDTGLCQDCADRADRPDSDSERFWDRADAAWDLRKDTLLGL